MNAHVAPRDEFAAAMRIDIGCEMCALGEIREIHLREEISSLHAANFSLSVQGSEHRAEAKRQRAQKRWLWALCSLCAGGWLYCLGALRGWL